MPPNLARRPRDRPRIPVARFRFDGPRQVSLNGVPLRPGVCLFWDGEYAWGRTFEGVALRERNVLLVCRRAFRDEVVIVDAGSLSPIGCDWWPA